ncbi:hypothetical protein KO493_05135 [Tamlana agarivorans]|uniref:Uncharacterized protein n=1 Tax=Pseudotamlana agarivorans TaxID=481183 RepID=A0ACC5U744_9FLAO|nr:hypothetical protein [Tamlana agarivorans]
MVLVFAFVFSCGRTSETISVDANNDNLKLDNGILLYQEVPFNGEILDYYKPEKLKSKMTYVDGKKHGAETQWYANGNLLIERFYKEGFKTGTHKSWYQDGTQKFEYHFNDKGEFHGVVKEWYKNAQIFRDFNYVNGKEVGRQRLWKVDGSLKANYEVVNGERFGLIGLKKCYTVTVNEDDVK